MGAVGQRGDHEQPCGREVENDPVLGHVAGEPHVGQAERLPELSADSKPMPACSRTVLCMPSAPTRYFAVTAEPSEKRAVTPSPSWVRLSSVYGLATRPPSSMRRSSRTRSVTAWETSSV